MTRQAERRNFHYIYKITRNDGKYYIGLHSTDNMEDGYFGSGQLLWRSIKKHGKDKHSKEILEFLPSRAEVKVRERGLVNEECLLDPLCMNLCLGGGGNDCNSPKTRKKISEAQKRRDPKTRLHTEETKQKIAASNRKPKDPEAVRHSVEARLKNMTPEIRATLGGNRGLVMSTEQKAKISAGVLLKLTPEMRAKMSVKSKANWTPERKICHAEKMRAYHASRRI